MACHLFGAKPLPEPKLTYHELLCALCIVQARVSVYDFIDMIVFSKMLPEPMLTKFNNAYIMYKWLHPITCRYLNR